MSSLLRKLAILTCAGAAHALATALCLAQDCNQNGLPDAWDLEPRLGFAAASSFDAGETPRAVAVGRMNGDSKPDMVVAGGASGTVTVLSGLGQGRFAPPRSFPAIPAPSALALGDLDGDGDDDVAVTSAGEFPEPGSMALLWNENEGELSAPQPLGTFSSPRAITCADLDGDGDLDLAMADRGTNEIVLLANTGERKFESRGARGVARGPLGLLARDFDRDGAVDLACVSDLSSTLSVLWNEGEFTFSAPLGLRSSRLSTRLAAGDLNGDGAVDLVASHVASRDLRVFLASGPRAFTEASTIPLTEEPVDLRIGDADSDGDSDVVVLQRSFGTDRLAESSDTPPHGIANLLSNNGSGSFPEKQGLLIGPRSESMELSDLDGDGRPEILAAHEALGTVSVLWNDAEHGFVTANRRPVASSYPFGAADLDRDGSVDLAVANDSILPSMVLWNAGSGALAERLDLPFNFVLGITAGDFDGDGDADLAIADRPAPWEEEPLKMVLCWNEGEGRDKSRFERRGSFELSRAGAPRAADIDGDGDLDIAMPGEILWNRGHGAFEADASFPLEPDRRLAELGDWDGDGDLDIAMTIPPQMEIIFFGEPGGPGEWRIVVPGAIALYTNRGPDGFQSSAVLPARARPSAVTSGDLDGDGDTDLAVTDGDAGEVAVWRNTGAGEFAPLATIPAGRQPESIDAGDIDQDGDVDLAIADAAKSRVMVLSNRGDGSFEPGESFAVNGEPFDLQLLDLEGGGSLSIAVNCRKSYDIWVLRSLTRPPRSTDCNGNSTPDECDIASGASADADQNGVPDECGVRFRRGETNEDGIIDLSDAITIFGYLFLGNPARLGCEKGADVDRSGRLDLSDGIALLGYLFLSGPRPASPFPGCGFDAAGVALSCEASILCD